MKPIFITLSLFFPLVANGAIPQGLEKGDVIFRDLDVLLSPV